MFLKKFLNYRTYDFYIELDDVCEELVKASELTYEQSKDDKNAVYNSNFIK